MQRGLKDSALIGGLSDLVSDVADLFQKEIRLAKAEIAQNISQKLNAGIWMIAAAVLLAFGALVAIQAIIFALIAAGLAPYWACAIVAGVLAAAAAAAFFKGRADASAAILPDRTIEQLNEDIKVTREQFQ